jgi:exosome complex component RRP41
LQHTIASTFSTTLLTHLHPHSLITLTLHVLSLDGSLLATCLNVATLALIDAGIPMREYVSAVTCGLTPSQGDDSDNEVAGDPILDVNAAEESEGIPFITIACLGNTATIAATTAQEGDGGEAGKVVVLVCETRVRMESLEGMVAVGVEGCRRVRGLMDEVVREGGRRVLRGNRG